MPEFPQCPASGPGRLSWLDSFDSAMWNLARTDRVELSGDGIDEETVEQLLAGMPDYLERRIRGAFEAEQLDWQFNKSA